MARKPFAFRPARYSAPPSLLPELVRTRRILHNENRHVESGSGAAPRRAPFPDPAHQTGRADLPHPAFGQGYLCFRPRQVSAEAFQAEQAELLVKILIAEAIAALSLDLVLVT